MGVLTRMQAPPADLSSMRAGTVCRAPVWSSHNASTKVITGFRNSGTTALIQDLSARSWLSPELHGRSGLVVVCFPVLVMVTPQEMGLRGAVSLASAEV